MVQCKVCTHPRAFEVMQKVFTGALTYTQAAKELQLPVPTVWNCFKEHWQTEITEDKITLKMKKAKTVEDYVGILKELFEEFIKRTKNAMQQPMTAYNDRAVTTLTKELRAIMRDILEFEGKLRVGPLIQLTVLQAQMTKLTSVLFSELCPVCQQKLLKVIPELQEAEVEST